jgi:putative iron-dependent peroxidase
MEKEEENKNLFQDGILSDSTVHSVFITIYVNQWKDYLDNIIELCGNFPDIIQYINQIYNENQKNNHIIGIIGMNSELTKKIFEPNEPKHLRDYITLKGPGGELPFTGGDIFIHIKCNRMDLCFLSQKILLESFVKRGIFFNSHIIYGFSYLVGTNGLGRDLTGFEDGTQNPKKFDKKLKTAIIDSNQDFNHEGGSFVITQQWVHNLEKFEALPKNLQEEVFGRTKDESKKIKRFTNKFSCSKNGIY